MPLNLVCVNDDVLHEIFRHFVAVDDDGPFTLILVCAKWREWVVSHPILWSWIILDDAQPEWREKAMVSAVLSRELPLQVILRVFHIELQSLQRITARCTSLLVESPCLREWDDALAEDNHVMQAEDLLQLENYVNNFFSVTAPNQITSFVSHGGWEAHGTREIYNKLIEWHSRCGKAGGLSPPPLVKSIYKEFDPAVAQPIVEIIDIWPILPHLPYLCVLELPPGILGLKNIVSLPVIISPALQKLVLDMRSTDIGLEKRRNRGTVSSLELIHRLKAPSLRSAVLRGSVTQMMETAAEIDEHLRPVEIKLSLTSIKNLPEDPVPRFKWLSRLVIDTTDIKVREFSLYEKVSNFLPLLPPSCRIQLIGGVELEDTMRSVPPGVHIDFTYCDGPFEYVERSQPRSQGAFGLLDPIRECAIPGGISSLTLEGHRIPQDLYISWVRSAESIIVLDLNSLRLLLTNPRPRATKIQALNTGVLPLWADSWDIHDYFLPDIQERFRYLTTLRCLPEIAEWIIKKLEIPQLTTLTLSSTNGPSSDYVLPFATLFAVTLACEADLPRLSTLIFELVPDWPSFWHFLRNFRKNSTGGISLVKLPGLPHPAFLRAIVYTLDGRWIGDDAFYLYFNSPNIQLSGGSGCFSCLNSGWTCFEGGMAACSRYSTGNMVSITRDTFCNTA